MEQFLDVPVPQVMEQLREVPKTVSHDRIRLEQLEEVPNMVFPYTPARLEALFKLSVVTILSHLQLTRSDSLHKFRRVVGVHFNEIPFPTYLD